MENFLFNTYQFFSIFLYLFLSVILIYHRLFKRWIKFSFGFFIVYVLGSYIFFGSLPIPFISQETVKALPYFLFFFGTMACVGYCLINGLSLGQSIGLIICYFFLILVFLFASGISIGIDLGIPKKGTVEKFLISLPYILFYVGSPIAIGFWIYRGMSLKEIFGAYMIFFFILVLAIVVTTNYFHRPFGFVYELNFYTRAWIEITSVFIAILGLPIVLGFCLLKSLNLRESLGTFIIFLSVMAGVISIIHLTMGYEFLGHILT